MKTFTGEVFKKTMGTASLCAGLLIFSSAHAQTAPSLHEVNTQPAATAPSEQSVYDQRIGDVDQKDEATQKTYQIVYDNIDTEKKMFKEDKITKRDRIYNSSLITKDVQNMDDLNRFKQYTFEQREEFVDAVNAQLTYMETKVEDKKLSDLTSDEKQLRDDIENIKNKINGKLVQLNNINSEERFNTVKLQIQMDLEKLKRVESEHAVR